MKSKILHEDRSMTVEHICIISDFDSNIKYIMHTVIEDITTIVG